MGALRTQRRKHRAFATAVYNTKKAYVVRCMGRDLLRRVEYHIGRSEVVDGCLLKLGFERPQRKENPLSLDTI